MSIAVKEKEKHTLLGAVDELDAVLEELAGDVEDLLDLVRHFGDFYVCVRRREERDYKIS